MKRLWKTRWLMLQETAEVQSWAERWWVVQHPSAVPIPPVKQGCCLPPCRGRGQCQSRFRRGGAINKGEREKMQANPAYTCPLTWWIWIPWHSTCHCRSWGSFRLISMYFQLQSAFNSFHFQHSGTCSYSKISVFSPSTLISTPYSGASHHCMWCVLINQPYIPSWRCYN